MKHLILRFDSTTKLGKYLLDDQETGGIFCATTDDLDLGETVSVTICLPDIPEGVNLMATVKWRRRPTRWRSSLVPGVGLGFLDSSAPQLAFLLNHLSGGVVSTRRHWPRHQLELPVEVCAGSEVYLSSTRDIGLGGMFVRFDRPCDAGSEVRVNVLPEGPESKVEFHGRVAWSTSGNGEPGFGLAFPPNDVEIRRRAERIILASEPPPPRDNADHARATATLWRKPRNKRQT